MLDQYSDDELEVVLAHELAHHVHGDIWTGIVVEMLLMLAGFFVADVVLRTAGPFVSLQGLADPAGVPLLLLAAGAVSVLLLPAMLALSRGHERRADRFALDLTSNPGAFTSAMKRLGAQNLAENEPSALVQWLFYSHPPLSHRLAAAAAWAHTHRVASWPRHPVMETLDRGEG
jgi:STE24 endopeptidase